ncbi:hypothetical protein BJY24_003292 [Nocardia transvalensis]|uniref:Uncharacterized protein n=1 Tax=Nocardia transvalensis TaxID=37333 RepID=A0A7W9PEI4_9NOCA|nr:hypothetical protein [Nocardia transvalensis]MBB5914425.1 hypothetical protein [Nocardia transvalensis]
MSLWGWPIGLIIAIAIPLTVLAAATLWPQNIPKDQTVEAIRRRIDHEDVENK